jgi:MFS family permease
MFWSLYAGTLVDKYSRKKIFLSINLFGAVALLLASYQAYNTSEVSMYLAMFVFSCTTFIYNIYYPNLYALAQEISDPKNYMRILSLVEIQGQAATVVSGGLAAVLLSGYSGNESELLKVMGLSFHFQSWSLADVFLLDGSTYFISFLLLLFMKYTPYKTNKIDTSSLKERFKFGINYLKERPDLLWLGIGGAAVFNTIIMCSYYQLPIYIDKYLEAKSYVFAGAEMCFAFGAMSAGFLVTYVFKKTNNPLKILILLSLGAMVYFIHTFNTNISFFIFLNFVIGLCNAGIRIYRNIYFFKIVPNNVIGRVNSVTNTSSYLTRFIMGLVFAVPFFNSKEGIVFSMLLLGLYILIFVIILAKRYTSLVANETQINEHQ